MARKTNVTTAILAALLSCSATLRAADPGDLFPDVPYSSKVGPSPVTHQEESLKNAPPAPAQPAAPVEPAPAQPETIPPAREPPSPDTRPATDQSAQTKPAEVKAAHGSQIWFPYAEKLGDPLLPAVDKAKFDAQDAGLLSAALRGSRKEKQNVSDQLFRRAGRAEDSPGLQRYLYLHSLGLAIRAQTSAGDREKKARAVLPMLTEKSLAVAQTRTDCLESLAGGTATGTLATLLVHSYATLAELQVQTGYPKEAYASLASARKWLEPNHPALLTTQLAATNEWVKRSEAAAGELHTLKDKLVNNSKDTAANTELAMIQLGIYGDLGKALEFAMDSDRPELQKLTNLAKDLDLKAMTVDSAADAQKSLPVIAAMVDVAKSAIGPDRYLIAYHAKFRLDELAPVLSAEDVASLNAAIKKVSDKITDPLDAYDSLEQLPDPMAQDQTADTTPKTTNPTHGVNYGVNNGNGNNNGKGNGNGNGGGSGGGGRNSNGGGGGGGGGGHGRH
jgi:hypothetical protein